MKLASGLYLCDAGTVNKDHTKAFFSYIRCYSRDSPYSGLNLVHGAREEGETRHVAHSFPVVDEFQILAACEQALIKYRDKFQILAAVEHEHS